MSRNAPNSENNNNVKSIVNNAYMENKRKRLNDTMDLPNAKLYKNNYYAVLDTENDTQCDKELLKKFENHVKQNKVNNEKVNTSGVPSNELPNTSKNNATPQVNNKNIEVNNENNKNKKVPPINIIDIETNQLIEFLKNGLKIKDFKIKEFRYKKSLFLNSLDDFLRVKAYLEKAKAKFFTFTPKGIKTKTYLLKGLMRALT